MLRIDAGHRLLVLVVEDATVGFGPELLASLVNRGLDERERGGFSRLRVVLGADNPGELELRARTWWKSVGNVDEKTHLHVIDRCQVPVVADP